MADYIVQGKKGDGKSLVCVGKIRDALLAGKAVATNLNLNLEKMLPAGIKNVRCYRLPDYPTLADMEAIGKGSDKLDESTYGLIVLDEMAVWMNSRQFADKARLPLLSWFVHSRKKRWDCMFICQSMNDQLDKQFRNALADHQVNCRRLDKVRVPFLGPLTKHILGKEIRPPKVHVAGVRYGMEHNAMKSDTWAYRGHDLYEAYDTEQVFDSEYPHGIYSYLSPWHLKGRFEPKKFKLSEWVRAVVKDDFPRPKVQPKPKHPLIQSLMDMAPDERIWHVRQLQASGAL
jgi:hypothetical protein